MVTELELAGAAVRTIDWRRGARDPIGAFRFRCALSQRQFAIVHQHFGGRSVRWLVRSATPAYIIVNLHGELTDRDLLSSITCSADAVLVPSSAVAEQLAPARPQVVHLGVRIPEQGFPPAADGADPSAITIGAACRLVPLKGLKHLILAFAAIHAEFPTLLLEIAGEGIERESLEAQVRSLGLTDRIKFLGWQQSLAPVLRRWQIYVLPTLQDAFPFTVLEAMTAGLPVVASAVGGLPELIEHGRTGWLVPPGDSPALANRLRELVGNATLRRQMGVAGSTRARENFSVDRMVATISTIYDNIIAPAFDKAYVLPT